MADIVAQKKPVAVVQFLNYHFRVALPTLLVRKETTITAAASRKGLK
jgi:hypothetical protein